MEKIVKVENDKMMELLFRLDERTRTMADEISQIKKDLNEKFVTIVEFRPIRLIVYGMAGAILIYVLMAILNFIKQ